MLNKIRIWDMDGCLVDSSWRYQLSKNDKSKIDLDHWRKHEKAAYFDPILAENHSLYLAHLNDPTCFVVIATARLCHSADLAFIDNKLGRPNKLICRRDASDSRGGAELKIEGLKILLHLKQFKNINDILVYEDNVAYLSKLCNFLKCKGVYIPSNQGH